MTQRQRVSVFVLAGVFFIAGVAGFAWLVRRQVQHVLHPAPVTEADKRLLVTAADLVPFGIAFDPRAETFTSLSQIDGSRTLQYDYQPSQFDQANRVYLQSFTFVQPQSLAARQMFSVQKLSMKAGMKFGGGKVRMVDAPELFGGGDDRYVALMKHEQSVVGNLFVIRQGRIVHSVILTGMAVEDPEYVQKLLEPMLEESRRRAR